MEIDVINILVAFVSIMLTGFLSIYLYRKQNKKSNEQINEINERAKKQLVEANERAEKQLAEVSKKADERLDKVNNGVDFYPIREGSINHNFYNHFERVIKQAKEDIYITGRGLNMDSRDKKIAEDYIKSFKNSLSNNSGLMITRVQYGENASEDWYSEFKELWQKFPKQLHFYVLDDSSNHDILHVATIDHQDSENCVTEIMLPTKKDVEDKEKEIAGSAIFVQKNIDLAISIKNRIKSIIPKCKKIDTIEKWEELINKQTV
ncbi:hypothetical protein [Maribacter sp. 2304DJ31-5]|uniref:hypothetical protein n=1 Tax=Maribacter sp. 2304DJ31-5 TaxID=3386273 RepID=UPI0039BCB1FA